MSAANISYLSASVFPVELARWGSFMYQIKIWHIARLCLHTWTLLEYVFPSPVTGALLNLFILIGSQTEQAYVWWLLDWEFCLGNLIYGKSRVNFMYFEPESFQSCLYSMSVYCIVYLKKYGLLVSFYKEFLYLISKYFHTIYWFVINILGDKQNPCTRPTGG